jgi:hypothetical protein
MDSHTDDARRSMEILSELAGKMRESEARCSAQADDADAAARNLRYAAAAYHEHGNALQGAINTLAGLLDKDSRDAAAEGPQMDVNELAYRIKQQTATRHTTGGPFAPKSAY